MVFPRSWMWNTIEYPWTSSLAQFLALFSLSMVLISTVTFIISTAEELQAGDLILVIYIIKIWVFIDCKRIKLSPSN